VCASDLTRTTDNTESGEMAYATVLRNSEIFAPHDGYGFAWRKQPEFLLRMNDGVGTAADIKEHVFEPFVTSRPQGTGLGLAVVKSVVAQHGGNIDLESQQGRGTKISLTLPQYVGSNDEYAFSKEDQKEVLL